MDSIFYKCCPWRASYTLCPCILFVCHRTGPCSPRIAGLARKRKFDASLLPFRWRRCPPEWTLACCIGTFQWQQSLWSWLSWHSGRGCSSDPFPIHWIGSCWLCSSSRSFSTWCTGFLECCLDLSARPGSCSGWPSRWTFGHPWSHLRGALIESGFPRTAYQVSFQVEFCPMNMVSLGKLSFYLAATSCRSMLFFTLSQCLI